jgi:tetratricopeptide (TPR) repeat protein
MPQNAVNPLVADRFFKDTLDMNYGISGTVSLLAMVFGLAGSLTVWSAPAFAQVILEQKGTLAPAQNEYTFDAEAGQVLAVVMTSDDFDTFLILLNSNGEEVAVNDDYGGTLNSRIIYSFTEAGRYTVVTKSFSGAGGNYDLQIRAATAYEVALDEAQKSLQVGDFTGAIAAYGDAIEIEPSNPEPYVGRADAYFGQAYSELDAQGLFLEGPEDLQPAVREAIATDFETAARLYGEQGDIFTAQSLRDQAQYVRTGEFPEYEPSEEEVPSEGEVRGGGVR